MLYKCHKRESDNHKNLKEIINGEDAVECMLDNEHSRNRV